MVGWSEELWHNFRQPTIIWGYCFDTVFDLYSGGSQFQNLRGNWRCWDFCACFSSPEADLRWYLAHKPRSFSSYASYCTKYNNCSFKGVAIVPKIGNLFLLDCTETRAVEIDAWLSSTKLPWIFTVRFNHRISSFMHAGKKKLGNTKE